MFSTSCTAYVATVDFQAVSGHKLIRNAAHEGMLSQHKDLAYPDLRGHGVIGVVGLLYYNTYCASCMSMSQLCVPFAWSRPPPIRPSSI
jgi:hypothetical protein